MYIFYQLGHRLTNRQTNTFPTATTVQLSPATPILRQQGGTRVTGSDIAQPSFLPPLINRVL